MMWDELAKIGLGLVPPVDAHPEKQYGWRVRVAVVTGTSFLGVVGITCLAFGWVPGFDGFARAAEVSAIVQEIRSNRADNIEGQLIDLRIKHCRATTDEAKQLYWTRISDLMVKYQQLTARVFRLPACSDL